MPAKAEIGISPEISRKATPRIFYEGDINKETSPYNLEINAPLFGQLLQEEFGMTPQQIEKLDVVVIGRGGRLKTRSLHHRLAEVIARRTGTTYAGITLFKDRAGRRKVLIFAEKYYKDFKHWKDVF